MLDLQVKDTFGRLSGLLQAMPFAIVEPAMVDAAKPAIFQPAIAEICPTVAAMQAEQARITLLVSKQDEVFSEQAHG